MSTSGDTTFNLQSSEIVAKAFSILGVGSEGENLSARQLEDGKDSLNLLVKTWGARPHLWTRTERSVTLVQGQAAYTLTPRAMRVLEVRRKVTASGYETPLGEWSRDEYISQPNKLVESIPVSFYFDPQTTASTLYIWPTPSAATATDMTLKLTYLRRMDDFDNTNDDADLPQEWLQALVWNLANDLEPEYPVNDPRLAAKIENRAAMLLGQLSAWDDEPASLYVQPDRLWR